MRVDWHLNKDESEQHFKKNFTPLPFRFKLFLLTIDIISLSVWVEPEVSVIFFSVKSQIVSILGFVDHEILVTTTQICNCSMKTTIDDT